MRYERHYNTKIQTEPENVFLLSAVAVIDALLGRKQDAIKKRKRPSEESLFRETAIDGANMAANLAFVYAWRGELDLTFKQLNVLTRIPNGVYYGHVKNFWFWVPLRGDPRYEEIFIRVSTWKVNVGIHQNKCPEIFSKLVPLCVHVR
jgi:hypothetical protein